MIKIILVGVWSCVIALVASYSAIYMKVHQGKVVGSDEAFIGIEYKRTRPLNIPVIDQGQIQGYIVAQFVFTADSKELKAAPVPIEIYVLDEAFRIIYSEDINFKHIEKYDVNGLTKKLLQRLHEKMKSDVIKDVMLEQFNYVEKAALRK